MKKQVKHSTAGRVLRLAGQLICYSLLLQPFEEVMGQSESLGRDAAC